MQIYSDTHTHTHHILRQTLYLRPVTMCDATAEVLSELKEQHQVKQYAGLNLGQAFPTGAHCE